MKTIVALSTVPMNCAIHIIRLSGLNAFNIVQKICKDKIIKKGYSIQHTTIFDDNKNQIDDVLIMKYLAPKSYTGEDMIEINCHGGVFIASKIIELLIKNGAIYAKHGEFTQRAFLNGKIDLLKANGINNSINATNLTSLKIAQNAINNKLTEKIKKFINVLFQLIGTIEVNIDYPEYDLIENITNKKVVSKLTILLRELESLYNNSLISYKINIGFNIVMIGKPNVGKSSLLNKFLHENKAIVSNIPGTTRDIVEGKINYKNITFNFIDTAGIRDKANIIEAIGIKKTYDKLQQADLIILVLDASQKITIVEKDLMRKIADKTNLIILNKSDLKIRNKTKGILFSCKNDNIQKIMDLIIKKINSNKVLKQDMIYLQTINEIGTLKNVIVQIRTIIKNAKNKQSIDLLIEDLHICFNKLNDLIGNNDVDFLEKMFANFCIGK